MALCVLLAQGCAGPAAKDEATFPDFSGIYPAHARSEAAFLARYLLGDERDDTGDVTLRSDLHGLTVLQQNHQSKLCPITDYSCVSPGEMKLVRKGEGHIKLLPLIDQTVTTTCVFKRDLSGGLQLDIYAQTVAAPHGVRLRESMRLEKSPVWPRTKALTPTRQDPSQ
ncbi:hypothetical protein [Variovorax sp. GrIS 2.14]|uniref:hypothetical protein n=1 Tax=Variovorax sp. GrIS 2.14 TaxID=3071709 RepID=UPI0038F66BFE